MTAHSCHEPLSIVAGWHVSWYSRWASVYVLLHWSLIVISV